MAKNGLIIVYNESGSPVCVSTKDAQYSVAGNGSLPLSFEEIVYINSTSQAFRIGLLFFGSDVEESVYKELKIHDWKSILHDKEIEDILLHPTIDSLNKLLQIQSEAYFERVRGVFTGLKSIGADMSGKVETIISARYSEFRNRKYKSAIQLTKAIEAEDEKIDYKEMQRTNEELAAQLEELREQVKTLTAKKQKAKAEQG
jgi:hypothetical protein